MRMYLYLYVFVRELNLHENGNGFEPITSLFVEYVWNGPYKSVKTSIIQQYELALFGNEYWSQDAVISFMLPLRGWQKMINGWNGAKIGTLLLR